MNDDLRDMLKISTHVGIDARLVQGGGGNTSVKTDGGTKMYIKASGTALGDMREDAGYRLVYVGPCLAILEDTELQAKPPHEREEAVLQCLVDSCLDDLEGRPSVETSLHALLGRCVVHTHPSAVNGLLCAVDGQAAVEGLFGAMEPPCLFIEFCGAGFPLALRMLKEIGDFRREHGCMPEVIFLANHGLFVTTEDADRALELTAEVFSAIEAAAGKAIEGAGLPEPQTPLEAEQRMAVVDVMAVARRFYSDVFGRPALARFDGNDVVRGFLRHPDAASLVAIKPMTPDEVVYCKAAPVWVDAAPGAQVDAGEVEMALAAREDGPDDTPTCLLVGGLGLFSAAPNPKLLDAVSATMLAALETLSIAAHFGGPRPLSDDMIQWMSEWEVERFRRALVAGGDSDNALVGKVALVTGAGSGIGRGVSQFLASAGMHVVLADIDVESARETAQNIAEQDGDGYGFPVKANATDEADVTAAVHYAVGSLGGVDLLVNCAGIAPAYPLVDFPLAHWHMAMEVNLTGYFLFGREAARCMIRQGTGGSIINISSKSGLEASKNNSAYNATKAGQIHLARGWALELAEHGIRVNVICPGNIFKGSRIWNEEYIKAVAHKRGIEPEEVIPYYTSLSALKQEITWDDIGEAVAFLAGPRAAKITGQSLVVDSGQVFVR